MSITQEQQIDVSEVKTIKILKLLNDKYDVFNQIDITQKGTIYHKRKYINQDVIKYMFYKYCKELNISTLEQLNVLINTYFPDMNKIKIDINKVIRENRRKAPTKNNELINSMNKQLKKKFKNIIVSREEHIKKYGYVSFVIKETLFNKFYFIPTKYGFIDYYNGVILLTDINIHNMYNVLNSYYLIKPNKEYSTDSNGYLKIITKKDNNNIVKLYDLRHKNITFKFWHKTISPNNEFNRIYINKMYINIDKTKQGNKIKSNYF